MKVIVTEVTPAFGATVWQAEGITPEGKQVRFAGDWRPMRDLYEAVALRGAVEAVIEPWQVLS